MAVGEQGGVVSEAFFFFNDTATTEIYTLSLHDALPIYQIQMCMHILDSLELVCWLT